MLDHVAVASLAKRVAEHEHHARVTLATTWSWPGPCAAMREYGE